MLADCKPVHGKLHGPENHLLCGTHGHVLDVKAKTIIAHDVKEYEGTQATAKAADKAAKDAAHKKAEDDKQRAEFHKKLGLRPTDVIMTVETTAGPAPELEITMEAVNTCPGPNLGVQGFAMFKFTGSLFLAQKSDIPPIGIASFTVRTVGFKTNIPLTFTQVEYDISKGGTLKLHAKERPLSGSTTGSTNHGTNSSDMSGRNIEGGGEAGFEVNLKVAKISGKGAGKYTNLKSHTEGVSDQEGESETVSDVRHSTIYDVTVG